MKDTKLEYQERIDHLKAGYDNTQNVVRFLDTKASAVVAGATAVFGLNVALIKWFFSFVHSYYEKVEHWCDFWFAPLWLMLVPAGFMSYYLFRALRHAYLTLIPRDTGSSKPSALFPMIPTVDEGSKQDATSARIELYGSNCTHANAIQDYTEQLKQMGRIVFNKMTHCKLSVIYLFRFIVSSGLFALLAVLVWFLHNNNM